MNRKKTACLIMLLLGLNGCLTPTRSLVREFDGAGRLVRETESSESVATALTRSTAGKTVVAWESGWAAYLSATTATVENPTPRLRLFAGKTDRGLVSALPGEQNWAGIAQAIRATKYDLSVGSAGVSSTSAAGTP